MNHCQIQHNTLASLEFLPKTHSLRSLQRSFCLCWIWLFCLLIDVTFRPWFKWSTTYLTPGLCHNPPCFVFFTDLLPPLASISLAWFIPHPVRSWRDHSLQALLQHTCINPRPLNTVYISCEASATDADRLHLCQKKAESYCKPKDISVSRLIFFFPFLTVQQFIELQVHLLTANRLQVHPVKANKLLVSWSFVLGSKVTKIAFPSADWLEHARTGSTFKIPLSCPSSLQWQLRPPRGKLINYGWMFDWQRLNDRSSVLTWLPHTENSVPIVFKKKIKKNK